MIYDELLPADQGTAVTERIPTGSKPGIDQLLIASALDADLLRKLLESPDEAFQDFELTEEQKDLLRQPDHRLLRLLGDALAHERSSPEAVPQGGMVAVEPHAVVEAKTLPDISLVLTVVPCAQYEDGRLHKLNYAMWVSPLAEGAEPSSSPPQGAVFPGQPLTPLHAVIQVSPLPMQDADGNPLIGLSAVFRQSSNITVPPPFESTGRAEGSPFGSDLRSQGVRKAVAAVHSAPTGLRYERLIDLLHALRRGEGQ